MKLAHLPNMISCFRILLCIGIIIMGIINKPFAVLTMVMFIIAGVTDMIDGPIARRIPGASSELGASLDSLADVFMIAVGIGVFMPFMALWPFLMPALIIILSIKIVVPNIISYIKWKEPMSLHTITFKVLVIFMFAIPLVHYFINIKILTNIWALVVISSAALFVLEEIIIVLKLHKPNRNIKSIFSVKSENLKSEAENPKQV